MGLGMYYNSDYRAISEVIAKYETKLKDLLAPKVAPKGVTVRQALPTDFGLTTNEWKVTAPASTSDWVNWINNYTVPDDEYRAILGFFNYDATHKVAKAVKITAGSSDIRLIPLEDIYAAGNVKVLGDDEVAIMQAGTVFSVRAYVVNSDTSAVDQNLGIIGLVAEPEGRKIAKRL